jgi:SAM-dependent methyltransferase
LDGGLSRDLRLVRGGRRAKEAGLKPGMRVLDLGCGAGDVAMLAADLVGPKGRVVGIDRSAEALDLKSEPLPRVPPMGGKRIDRPGAFMEPTILADIKPGDHAFREEFFGPVALFFRVKNEDEAVALANDWV